jgi:hypothetical protein
LKFIFFIICDYLSILTNSKVGKSGADQNISNKYLDATGAFPPVPID